MHPALAKTFGGLSSPYYFRQLFFGMLVPALLLLAVAFSKTPGPTPWAGYIFLAINTPLYPYSRFVFDSIAGFILGENVYFLNLGWMITLKWATILVCYFFAIVIAPIGLVYLYIHHSRNEADGDFGT